MKFTCQKAGELLLDFLEHGLPGAVHRQMAEHLAQCQACAEFARTYAATAKMCCDLWRKKEAPADAADRLLAALRDKLGGKS
jgi:predicted anti-sigma-YlaC factor YlaD